MNFTALQTFLAVVETGNLNKAAGRLNVTQSTVTARLDALDAALGQALLVRSRRGAQLTRAGFAFRPHAELLVRGWSQAKNAVGLPKGFSGLFSFATQFDLWESVGKRWFQAVRLAHPDLAFEAWPAALAEIKDWLSSGLTDAALVTEPISAPGLASRACGMERLIQVSTTRRKAQAWHDDYIYVDLGPEFRRQHSEAWPTDETAALTFAASTWALDHMLTHGGSAYLPFHLAEPHLEEKKLHLVVGSPELSRSLILVWREASHTVFPWIDEDDFLIGLS